MCEVVGDKQVDRKCNSKTIQPSKGSSCRVEIALQIEIDNGDINGTNSKCQISIGCSISRTADERGQQVWMQKLNNAFSDLFVRNWVIAKARLAYRLKMTAGHTVHTHREQHIHSRNLQEGAGQTTKATDNNAPWCGQNGGIALSWFTKPMLNSNYAWTWPCLTKK